MTLDKVKEIIASTMSIDEDTITMEASLKDDLGMDSLDAMELSLALEDACGIKMEEEALKTFVTVGDVVEYLESHTA